MSVGCHLNCCQLPDTLRAKTPGFVVTLHLDFPCDFFDIHEGYFSVWK